MNINYVCRAVHSWNRHFREDFFDRLLGLLRFGSGIRRHRLQRIHHHLQSQVHVAEIRPVTRCQ